MNDQSTAHFGRLAAALGLVAGLLAACGGGSGSGSNVSVGGGAVGGGTPPVRSLSLLAGNIGAGSVDGSGTAARFLAPGGITLDGAGNVYVADTGNHTIRKITPAGVVTTLAGLSGVKGAGDGTGSDARFSSPQNIVADSVGNVYVSDLNAGAIRKVSAAGVVTTLALSLEGGAQTSLAGPTGITMDVGGNLYLLEVSKNGIRKITPAGVASTLTGTEIIGNFESDPLAHQPGRNDQQGIAVDRAGNLYVARPFSLAGVATMRVLNVIGKVTPAGAVSTLAGKEGEIGAADGAGADARFSNPIGIAVDGAGNAYVADKNNCTIRKITPAGVVGTLAGTAAACTYADGSGAQARFVSPAAIAVDSAGTVYVADSGSNTIRKITPAGVVTTLAGSPLAIVSADGAGAAAVFGAPAAIAADSAGYAYVADGAYGTIRKVAPDGLVSTLAGTAGLNGNVDGVGAAARFGKRMSGIAADSAGNLYVADASNRTIRKISAGGTVSTLAGNPALSGGIDGTGTAASFVDLRGIAVDGAGNLYVSDDSTVRKITPAAVVSTLAGTQGKTGSVDGTGAAALFSNLSGLALDGAGNVYAIDHIKVRKISASGAVSTLGGPFGGQAFGSATVLTGIAADADGNLYLADNGAGIVQNIAPSGSVTTLAGVPNSGNFTPGLLPGTLQNVAGIARGGSSLYIVVGNALAVVRNVR